MFYHDLAYPHGALYDHVLMITICLYAFFLFVVRPKIRMSYFCGLGEGRNFKCYQKALKISL